MSCLDRLNNFRTNYVGLMVGDKAECCRFQIEEHVLKEDVDVDLTKLAQFAFKHHVPRVHHVPIWKLLLRVSSSAPEVKRNIAEFRTEEAQVLFSSLRVMRMTSVHCDVVEQSGAKHQPTATDIVRMIELANGFNSLRTEQPALNLDFRARLAIADHMSVICGSNWVDTYWLTKSFDELLSRIFTTSVLDEIVNSLKSQYVKANATKGERFDGNFWVNLPMDLWIRCGGAAIFDHEPLLSMWDKVCSSTDFGIIRLLSTIIYRYLIEIKPGDSVLKNSDSLSDENTLSIKTQNVIIAKSIDSMIRSGKFGSRKYET